MKRVSDLIASDPVKLAHLMRQVDACYWAYWSRLRLQGGVFTLKGHKYQIDPLSCDHPRQAIKKAAQMGFTEVEIIKSLHGAIYGRYPLGVMYLFPTQGDVSDFSNTRFKSMIQMNPSTVGRYVKDTNNVHVKRIRGAFFYFRGAKETGKIEGEKETSSRLKSTPVDRLVFDEFDEMSPHMVDLARERLSHSEVKEESYVSTPSIPDYGIDRLYQESDQRVWMIKCEKCGKETCLELEFPECLHRRPDGEVVRICIHCRDRELRPEDGRWVPLYPDRSNELVGWWISQLNSAYVKPGEILNAFENPPNGNIAEVYNSKLGMAYIAAENRLTVADVLRCCGQDAMAMSSEGPCAMGVDVGRELHVVVGKRVSEKARKIIYLARVGDFADVYDIGKRFGVKSAVIDMEPETRKAREFQRSAPYKVFLCDYQERLKVSERLDEQSGVVTVRRTEICDRTHELVTTPGLLEIPRMCEEVKQFAIEMSNIAKTLEEDSKTGIKRYCYRKLGDDHYRHALNYFELAINGLPQEPEITMTDSLFDEKQNRYDPLGRV